MGKNIVFATKNNGKIKEINEILKETDFNVISMAEAGIEHDVVEDGTSFEENAIKKAKEIMEIAGTIVLADDSGLEVDYINKEPGIYSARYGGENTPYKVKNQMILDRLTGAKGKERSARFVSVIAAVFPDGRVMTTKGTVEGVINEAPKGDNGFGYDPIFYVPEYDVTMAQMPLELKNEISHRGKALRAMKRKLEGII